MAGPSIPNGIISVGTTEVVSSSPTRSAAPEDVSRPIVVADADQQRMPPPAVINQMAHQVLQILGKVQAASSDNPVEVLSTESQVPDEEARSSDGKCV